jgi:uncharacterized protein YgfB (UPF0149 family)
MTIRGASTDQKGKNNEPKYLNSTDLQPVFLRPWSAGVISVELPDLNQAVESGQGQFDVADLAECHGVLCGMICRHHELTATDFLHQLKALELVEDPPSALHSDLIDLFDCTRTQLADEEMGFRMWLPDDDQTLDERTISLARWCTGLVAGIGPIQQKDGQKSMLSSEAVDALEDISQIAEAGISGEEDSEEDEVAFFEIIEYVRVVTLMLREDLRGPGEHDFIH